MDDAQCVEWKNKHGLSACCIYIKQIIFIAPMVVRIQLLYPSLKLKAKILV